METVKKDTKADSGSLLPSSLSRPLSGWLAVAAVVCNKSARKASNSKASYDDFALLLLTNLVGNHSDSFYRASEEGSPINPAPKEPVMEGNFPWQQEKGAGEDGQEERAHT